MVRSPSSVLRGLWTFILHSRAETLLTAVYTHTPTLQDQRDPHNLFLSVINISLYTAHHHTPPMAHHWYEGTSGAV